MNDIDKALDITPIPMHVTEAYVPEQVDEDFEVARGNLYDTIETSKEAIAEMLMIAKNTQHPRAFEVLNQMIKTMSEVNKDLLDLQKLRNSLVPENSNPKNVTNNLFVGSTAQLQSFLSGKMKNEQ